MKQMKWQIWATILNAKTIIPLLEKNIPLNLNTFNHENNGTLILQILMHQVLKHCQF
jgi:aspartokinase